MGRTPHRSPRPQPDNVYLAVEGKLKLLDFGIAAQVRNTASAVGLSGFDSPGTLGYAPPESGSNRKADPRSDIYSLGILSYELLEGQLPFNGLRQPTTLLPEKPEVLNEAQWQVLQKAMAFEVEKRYSSVKEFWQAFDGSNGPSAEEIERCKQEEAAQAAAAEQAARKAKEEAERREEIRITEIRQAEKARAEAIRNAEEARAEEVARKAKQETESQKARERGAEEAASQEIQRQQSAPKASPEQMPVKGGKIPYGLVIGIVVIVTGGFVFMAGSGKQEAMPAVVSPPTSTPTAAESAAPTFVATGGQLKAWVDGKSVADSVAPTSVASPQAPIYQAGQTFKDCPDCPGMVVIPAGSFDMGSPVGVQEGDYEERPMHQVTIQKAFGLGKYELTVGEFRSFVQETGYRTDAEKNLGRDGCFGWDSTDDRWDWRSGQYWNHIGLPQSESHPVVCLSWNDAKAYVDWMGRKTGKTYRLPSESEWEYAARAGSTTSRPWGDNPNDACVHANVADLTKGPHGTARDRKHECSDGHWYSAPVGTFRPNRFGAYDMIGNVMEWVEDCQDLYDRTPTDGSAKICTSGARVLRGSSWFGPPSTARSAFRYSNPAEARFSNAGFRVARVL